MIHTVIIFNLHLIPGQSHPIGSDRNSSEVVGIFGIGFRPEVVGCQKMPESQDTELFRHPTTSHWNPIPKIPTTSDEFLLNPTIFPIGSDGIRQSDYSS